MSEIELKMNLLDSFHCIPVSVSYVCGDCVWWCMCGGGGGGKGEVTLEGCHFQEGIKEV